MNTNSQSNEIKVAVYGGNFKPIHNGHLNIIEKVSDTGLYDKIRILPCRFHADKKNVEDIEYRVDMIHKATRNMPRVVIDYTEAESKDVSYTANTLKTLRQKHPNEKYSFILGTDVFNSINTWGGYEYIRDTTPLIIIKREGYNLVGVDSDNVDSINGFQIEKILDLDDNISSTMIRQKIQNGESIENLVPERVLDYIVQNNLYGKKEKKKFENPGCTADAIAEYENQIILVKRKFSPFKDYWAIPGGFLENGKESLEQACVREFKEEVSGKAKIGDIELVGVYSDPKRDPRGHVISHAYAIKKFKGQLKAKDDAAEIGLFHINSLPDKLAFDHAKILSDYRRYKERNYQRF